MEIRQVMTDLKQAILNTLAGFNPDELRASAIDLLNTLGYASEKQPDLPNANPETFISTVEDLSGQTLNRDKALVSEWVAAELLFQLTDDDIRIASNGQLELFESSGVFNGRAMESYVFAAIRLRNSQYTRTDLAQITRSVNRLFPMPVIILFVHGDSLTLSIIERRLNKRETGKDVLEKVTQIKDIRLRNPHRAHTEILNDLALPVLAEKHECHSFVQLHEAWRKTLDTNELNKKFYRELADWYFWALEHVDFPDDVEKDTATRKATSVIRLLTRLIFCWFLKEKGLIPDALFSERRLKGILKSMDDTDSSFYLAILQNLFFGTLNQRMNAGEQEFRRFAKDGAIGDNKEEYGVKNLYRYQALFAVPEDAALELFEDIPFLNGGLFDCLDKEDENGKVLYVDGFTRNPKKRPTVPNFLFFSDYRTLDLSDAYGDKRHKSEKVRGLINLLDSYKFTVTENTPIDEEIALDPELLGKVFENLLASYNPETGTTARKQTGSFYTPREIVNYMVDESLIAYLEGQLKKNIPRLAEMNDLADLLREVFAYTEKQHPFDDQEVDALIDAIDACKILDPACGSGAFPMGILHKLVFILGKLDSGNIRWKQRQLDKLDSAPMREELERTFRDNDDDYGRKLYLIENCIYGVDIQPIAIQISKLRFFISLLCDQRTCRDKAKNCGVRPLPNLETKFVAANTLISLERRDESMRSDDGKAQGLLFDQRLPQLEADLKAVRHKHFAAQRRKDKLDLQKKDCELRKQIADVLADNGMSPDAARQLAAWDPYDQNISAPFFDPEWMFGIADGFDVVLGNPPYVDSETMSVCVPKLREALRQRYVTAQGNWDLFVVFVERGIILLCPGGHLTLIVPNKLISAKYTEALRRYLAGFSPLEIRDYSHLGVFQEADVYPVTIFVQCSTANRPDVSVVVMKSIDEIASRAVVPSAAFNANIEWSKYFQPAEVVKILLKLADLPKLSDRYGPVLGAATVAEAYEIKAAVTESRTGSGKRLINTGTIDPYCSLWGIRPTQYIKGRYSYPLVPEAALRRISITRAEQANATKVIVAGMSKRVEAFLDKGDYLAGKSTTIVLGKHEDLKLLVGILNSSVIAFYLNTFYHALKMAGGYINIGTEVLSCLPVPEPLPTERIALDKLIDRVISAKNDDPESDTADLEREIDERVYGLYRLTAVEIAVIEEALGESRK